MANRGRTEVRIDVASVTRELQKMVSSSDNNNSLITSSCSIFRVPNILYRHNPKAYQPNAFSIGPFHHDKPHLQDSQQVKVNYLKALLLRTNSDQTVVLRDLTRAVSEIQETARSCYAGPTGMGREDFVKTLVLDGCFLIELFLRNAYKDLRDKDGGDPIFSASFQIQFLCHDLILLENQIPWIVLNRLYTKINDRSQEDTKSLVQLAICFFQNQSSFSPNMEPDLPSEVEHILDLLRSSMVMSFDTKNGNDCNWENNMPSVSTLKAAGIKFREKRDSKSILDLGFDNCRGVLNIPQIEIHELTEPLFRNLISYEQCRPNCKGIVTSFAIVLDNLINTKEDMAILGKYGVVRNWLNDEDAAGFFNRLYDDTFVKHFYYTSLIEDVNEYCQRRWPKYRTHLMNNYFKYPWSILSVLAAVTILVLTFLQTFYTIYNHYS